MMGTTIEAVLEQYRPATSEQVRLWSFGSLKRRLRAFEDPNDWSQTRGTLWDQQIFGPIEDYRCACGRCFGEEYSGAICFICNVKVSWKKTRRFRFGHINLSRETPLPHPFFADAEPLDAVPVAPAVYWETSADAPLANAYEEMLHLALIKAPVEQLVGAFGVILAHLEKHFEEAPAWDPFVAQRIARAMILTPNPDYEVREEGDEDGGEETDTEPVDWDNLKLAD